MSLGSERCRRTGQRVLNRPNVCSSASESPIPRVPMHPNPRLNTKFEIKLEVLGPSGERSFTQSRVLIKPVPLGPSITGLVKSEGLTLPVDQCRPGFKERTERGGPQPVDG